MSIRSKYRKKYGLIPYALDPDGNMILPENAKVGQPYHCPECKGKLYVCTSKLNNPYFAHYYSRKDLCGLNESSIALAKHILRITMNEWLNGNGDPIEVHMFCGQRHQLPQKEIHTIHVNHRIRIGKKSYLAHLSLIDQYGHPILNIEIRDTARIRHIKHPSWLEVSAEEILSNPYLLSSLNPHMSIPYFSEPVQLELQLS